MDHMMFGMVLQENIDIDEDGNEVKTVGKIKTRAGKSTKLSELLDEARDRALRTFQERKAGKTTEATTEEESKDGEVHNTKVQIESDEEMAHAAEVLGISAVKYFDLSRDRTQNYTFSFDAMLDP
jgi:arginyl-tRNA synthetase